MQASNGNSCLAQYSSKPLYEVKIFHLFSLYFLYYLIRFSKNNKLSCGNELMHNNAIKFK